MAQPQMLPYDSTGSFVADGSPRKDAIGLRVYVVADSTAYYGRVLSVQNKNVTLQLERRWNHRTKVTVNWTYIRIAHNQETPPPVEKAAVDSKRIDSLRSKVFEATHRRHHITHYNDADAKQMVETCNATYETLQEYLQNFDAMRLRIHSLLTEMHAQRERCVAYGVDHSLLPPRVDSVKEIEVRTQGRKQKNADQKRKLTEVREKTRELLVALLLAAGDTGVSSDEVVGALCGLTREDRSGLSITQHRVMGMLSAFSRRQEAEMIGQNRWRATEILLRTNEVTG